MNVFSYVTHLLKIFLLDDIETNYLHFSENISTCVNIKLDWKLITKYMIILAR